MFFLIDNKNIYIILYRCPTKAEIAAILTDLITIKYVLEQLHLQVSLHKVNAHSNDSYNDLVDQLAKEGCNNENPISISPIGIPAQHSSHISFNDEFIIDRDIERHSRK
ncbi:unnamed protein product [Rhizophagus irregularis]|nr:unnamed protein product [Rhizophagus irregularis]